MQDTPFKIYNASAGSGKTFTLVKEYLKILLQTSYQDSFKQVLAITFTNKAVNEMKERIIKNLEEFSNPSILEKPSPMFSGLAKELGLTEVNLMERSEKILKRILHNYAFFDVVTIDKFNHRLLRTFAFDLKLPMNFEVALDTELLIEEAIDQLIFKAGTEEKLTKVLVDFALEKADDDKSWDIAIDLKKVASLLLNENHSSALQSVKNETLDDFLQLNALLRKKIKAQEHFIKKSGQEVLELLQVNGLEIDDFSRGMLPAHFKKIASGKLDGLYNNKLGENIAEGKVYNKTLDPGKKAAIDGLLPELQQIYLSIRNAVFNLKFLQNFYKNSTPLSLLNAIQAELEIIKDEQNLLLISEFNSIISDVIVHEPAPFIYERIGEKYRHYFIDEFQDTSEMQWNNLIPLVSNALESETLSGKRGSLLIVGDAKQAIYRWRGGKAEQFIDLYNCENPFQVEKMVENLPVNYRSCEEIVSFNNDFFKHISAYLTKEDYRDLFFSKSHQKPNQQKGGYVQIDFIDKKEEEDTQYCQLVLNRIKDLIAEGYRYNDICILTRKKKHGLVLSNFLLENEIDIISSESLLLKSHPKIGFLINLIRHTLQPQSREIQIEILHFLAEKGSVTDKHHFFSSNLGNMESVFSEYSFVQDTFYKLPFLNAVEYAIYSFGLYDPSDAYLQFFLDEILDFSIKQNSGFGSFISYWEKKKDRLSVISPEGNNAVKLMTIHKSKGLEFPVVIYPYAQSNIYEEIDPRLWMPVDKDTFGLSSGLFSKNKDFSEFSEYSKTLYDEDQAKLELDQFNLLYVALTRAVEQLHIFSKKDIRAKGEENLKSFSGLFINYLKSKSMWEAEKDTYSFGSKLLKMHLEDTRTKTDTIPFLANATDRPLYKIITRSGSLWDTTQEKAIQKGNLYHYLLSQISYAHDLESVIQDALYQGHISQRNYKDIEKDLSELIHHPLIHPYFTTDYTIYNEHDIYTAEGQLIRPDRLAVNHRNEVVLIDYKTGAYKDSFKLQLDRYAEAIEEMGLRISDKLIVFINEKIEIKSL
ncbi:UvrD-helicase domain-containing protein [Leptobacterium flavescens]|uniref:DNA 3'-5' helicase n=1 Tax=Leptobacterium flavescens TaxID=472055 RepID=A0A6P0UV78_9FLAO|nr:UvrD-helicase domain-containing protein [Leptobacterium flavescens]NER14306.1 UvrD-helicase domain-containing protein [Leptobacterium flavescens]